MTGTSETPSETTVYTFTYDTAGNLLTESKNGTVTKTYHYDNGTMASINPLRYRGYYCDSETGFYYLQSRYYDPVTHRFINADSSASTGQGIIGTNMFAYCLNNPANYYDCEGQDAIRLQEPSSAKGFGHSGVLVQGPDGEWYYFYWGPISEDISVGLVTGTTPIIILQPLNTEGLSLKHCDLSTIPKKAHENRPPRGSRKNMVIQPVQGRWG